MSGTKNWIMQIEEDFNDMVSDRKSATEWLLGDFKSLHNANHEKLTNKNKEELDALSDSDFKDLFRELVLDPIEEAENAEAYYADLSYEQYKEGNNVS
tara:strand:+ start:12792 stop:13085 length:294 start_codon:yes stop_codon:yes gene_type:complete